MLCSALRRAAVGWESFANVSCERIASFWPRNRVLARIGLFGRVSETRDLAFCRQGPSQGLPNPTFSCQSAVSCPFSDDFSARSPPNRWRAENPPEKAQRILCADSEREGLLCADSAGEGLDDGRNPRLGWRGRKRAALLPARSETHGQSAPRRPGSSLPVRAAIRCPPPCFSRQGQLGHPPPSSVTDPDPMGSSGGGDRHQVTLRRGADRPSRTALCPCPREGSDALPAGARFRGGRGLPPGACAAKARPARASHRSPPARSHSGRADTPWPFPFRRALFAASCRISFASRSAIFAANLVKPSFLS